MVSRIRHAIAVTLVSRIIDKTKEPGLATPNYSYEKRQRELAKKRKAEEKRQRKLSGKPDDAPEGEAPPLDEAGNPVPQPGSETA